eukprot:6757470-Alexandrium_andersonii.AAC.1
MPHSLRCPQGGRRTRTRSLARRVRDDCAASLGASVLVGSLLERHGGLRLPPGPAARVGAAARSAQLGEVVRVPHRAA